MAKTVYEIGKREMNTLTKCKESKKRRSEAGKRRWANLPDQTKNKIIGNLKAHRPKRGKKPKVNLIFPD